MTAGQENGALAGKGTGKQKSGERREEEVRGKGRRVLKNKSVERKKKRGEIKGTVKRKNSASSSSAAAVRLGVCACVWGVGGVYVQEPSHVHKKREV